MIAFDAVAAWHLATRGFGIDEWLEERRLRRYSEGRDSATGQGLVCWRLRPEMPPSGAWASRLTVTVREDGTGHTVMDHLNMRGATYMPPGDGVAHAALLTDAPMPETVVAALVGRRVGDVVDLPPVAHRPIVEAHVVDQMPGVTPSKVLISFLPVFEEVETPFYLLP